MPRQPMHLVNIRPWPLLTGLSALGLTYGLVSAFHYSQFFLLILAIRSLFLTLIHWWRDVCRERTFTGHHNSYVEANLRIGMLLFIISEVCFFGAFFWAFFHRRLSPTIELGCNWPPKGIHPLDPYAVPLLNTIILLSSGATVTWAHHALCTSHSRPLFSLAITILLGAGFTALQAQEYLVSTFCIADGIYSSTFFLATGFHGIHVIVGTSFLSVCFYRFLNLHFSPTHHFGFEAAAWYWHFVDIVWLFLFAWVYIWGS